MTISMFIISVIIGFLLGIISGLVPGIHTNTFAFILAAFAPGLSEIGFSRICIATIVVSNSLTHTFLDIIPSIFLGAPEADTSLAVLPGHQMLLDGFGPEAVRLSALGSAGSVLFSLILILPLTLLFMSVYPFLDRFMGWVLLCIVFIMIYTERGEVIEGQGSMVRTKYRIYAAVLFLISGLLGIFAFGSEQLITPIVEFGEPSILMPLFSGLFGASTLIISMSANTVIPIQVQSRMLLSPKRLIRGVMLGSTAGSFVAWLPGVTSAVATVIARLGVKEDYTDEDSSREFIVSLSGVNTANAIFGLVALYVIGRTRSGAMVAVSEVLTGISLDLGILTLLFIVILIVSIASYFTTVFLGDKVSSVLIGINYRRLCGAVLMGMAVLVLLTCGWFGLVVFTAAIPIGMLAPHLRVRRSHVMGTLLLPLILFYLWS